MSKQTRSRVLRSAYCRLLITQVYKRKFEPKASTPGGAYVVANDRGCDCGPGHRGYVSKRGQLRCVAANKLIPTTGKPLEQVSFLQASPDEGEDDDVAQAKEARYLKCVKKLTSAERASALLGNETKEEPTNPDGSPKDPTSPDGSAAPSTDESEGTTPAPGAGSSSSLLESLHRLVDDTGSTGTGTGWLIRNGFGQSVSSQCRMSDLRIVPVTVSHVGFADSSCHRVMSDA